MKEEIDSQVMEDIMVKHGKVSHKKESSHQGYKPDPNISGTVKPASKKGRSQRHLHSK
jgi:broad specificity phosphatase PhoE